MADEKLSALPATATPAATDQHYINQGATSKRLTTEQILQTGGVNHIAQAFESEFGGSIIIESLTIADDNVGTFSNVPGNSGIYILIVGGRDRSAMFTAFTTSIPIGLATGADVEYSAATLTGTTGTDTKVTISPNGSSSTLTIENRLGSTLAIALLHFSA